MKINEKIIEQYFESNKENASLENFLDFIYFIKFSGYLKKTFSETRKKYYIKQKTAMDKLIYIEPSEMNFEDIANPEEEIQDIDNNIENYNLFSVIQGLSEKQKLVIYGYYVYEKSERDISMELKITRQAVNRIRNRALKYLYNSWGENK
jgi:RNA polymerase sigma factor (sigma-70 family)